MDKAESHHFLKTYTLKQQDIIVVAPIPSPLPTSPQVLYLHGLSHAAAPCLPPIEISVSH